jgi:hypothetical protein
MKDVTIEEPPVVPEPTPMPATTPPPINAIRDSTAIRRLMEEVRCEDTISSPAKLGYDRAHNRHNRS